MTERSPHESSTEGILVAIRILAEHIGMSTDARRRISVAIGDQPEVVVPEVPVDPRDAELAELRAYKAGQAVKPAAKKRTKA